MRLFAIGGAYFWCPAGNALIIGRQIRGGIFDNLFLKTDHWHCLGSSSQHFYLNIYFVGKTVQQSQPVVLFHSRDNRTRQRAMKVAINIPWLRQSGLLVASRSGPFWEGVISRAISRRHVYRLGKTGLLSRVN